MKSPIRILIFASLLVGLFTFKNYGESWDEPDIYRYGEYALDAYQYITHPQDLPNFDTNLDFYGPAYFILVSILAQGLMTIFPTWSVVEAWHLLYFLTFLAGVYVFYLLARRWLSEWAALGVTLLFLTQPLLWGHAFINPKDTPFMVFFMMSVYFGLRFMDAELRLAQRWVWVALAGIFLGLTISLRVLGPLAGMIVLANAGMKDWRKTLVYSVPYLCIAGLAAYLTWPFLWAAPVANYLESLRLMSEFPFDAAVLFNGTLYPPEAVPRLYFPILFALQLTEPVLLLFLIGMIALLVSFRQRGRGEPVVLISGWLILPALAVIVLRSNLYDNARQLYFLLPPIFLVAGFTLDLILKYVTRPIVRSTVLFALALPGLFAIVQLQPFEYVYYNSFIGGVDGAAHRFETDYWGTSFKNALEYLNGIAPEQARILVLSGPDDIARRYARTDLQIVTEETDYNHEGDFDYVLILTRKNLGEQRCRKSETVHTVGRDDVVFTFVKKLGPDGLCK